MSKNNLGPTILWILLGIAIAAVALIGSKILFLFGGLFLIVFGLLNIFSKRFDEGLHKLFGESEIDKKFMSEKDRYLTRRYLSGFRFILLGILLIWVFSWWYEEILNKILGWFR